MDETLIKAFAAALDSQANTNRALLKAIAGDGVDVDKLLQKTAGNAGTGSVLHGWDGLFSTPGLSRDVISAHVRPVGLASRLPWLPSVEVNPIFPSLTGFSAPIGSQPTTSCGDAPTGYVKGCNLTARFGRVRYDTPTIDYEEVMLKINRSDFTDLRLAGQIFGLTGLEPSGMNPDQILNVLTMKELVVVGVLFEREILRQLWQGVTTVANEFPGLDVQIATGQKDATTGTTCPALDSDVKSYNYALISSTIVNYMSTLEMYIYNNAEKMGLNPATWVWCMRTDLWLELTAIWPCAYNTVKCSAAVGANASVTLDGREMVALRDSMRSSQKITVNGRTYDVILDDGIYEKTNVNNANVPAGSWASNIYFVPLTIIGGMPVTYVEHVDYQAGRADLSLLRNMQAFWTDGGKYLWALEQNKWCYKFAGKIEPRVVLRTPQLAGRIDNVRYAPLQHLRDSDPSSSYFADGGISLRSSGTREPYAVWTSR